MSKPRSVPDYQTEANLRTVGPMRLADAHTNGTARESLTSQADDSAGELLRSLRQVGGFPMNRSSRKGGLSTGCSETMQFGLSFLQTRLRQGAATELS